MTAVPTPPAGLANRIKRDIPADLGVTTTRQAPARWGAFAMRIAASLFVVISSVYVGIRLLSRTPAEMSIRVRPRAAAPPEAQPAADKVNATPAEAQNAGKVLASAPAPPSLEAEAAHTKKEGTPPVQTADAALRDNASVLRKDERAQAAAPEPQADRTIAYAPAAAPPAPVAIAQQSSAPAAPTAVAEVKAARPAAQITREEAAAAAKIAAAERNAAVDEVLGGALGTAMPASRATTVTSNAPSRAKSIAGIGVAAPIARNRFGISTDPLAVERIREALERGERPADVNVAALVNYFAGTAEEPVSDITINVEASPAPVSLHETTGLVRVSIDTPEAADRAAKVIARDARLSVEFDPHAVALHRLVGGGQLSTTAETALSESSSVTALFEVELKPGLRKRQRVATVELRYHDVSGRERTISRELRAGDFARTWPDSSRRHRLASLGAIWGETLKFDTNGAEVAKRAEDLARQEPGNSKARELARLATASSRLRSSGPTGSAR